MRTWKISLIVVVLVCFGGLAGNQAFGVVPLPFEDGFENRPAGDYPDENGWQVMFSGQSAAVSDTVAKTGDKSFRLESASSFARQDYVSLETIPDVFSYQASVYIPASEQREGTVGFLMKVGQTDAPQWNAFHIKTVGGANSVKFGTSASFGEGGPAVDVGTYTAGTWATVRADLNYNTLEADLWLNGVLEVEGTPIKAKEWYNATWDQNIVTEKWGLAGSWGGGTAGNVYFDDLLITPEPATLGLVILGGLALLKRKSKQA